jgi:hypothetical protein
VAGRRAGADVAEFVSSLGGIAEGSATQEEIVEYHQVAHAISVSMIPYFTGERSSRISENEREIAKNNARLLDSTTSLTQAEAARKNLMKLYLKSEFANAIAEGKPMFDLSGNTDDVVRLHRFLQEDLGISAAESKAWIKEYEQMQRIGAGLSR